MRCSSRTGPNTRNKTLPHALLTQFNRRTGPQTQGNKTLPHALLTQFNRRTGPQTQGNKTLPHALLTQFNRRTGPQTQGNETTTCCNVFPLPVHDAEQLNGHVLFPCVLAQYTIELSEQRMCCSQGNKTTTCVAHSIQSSYWPTTQGNKTLHMRCSLNSIVVLAHKHKEIKHYHMRCSLNSIVVLAHKHKDN